MTSQYYPAETILLDDERAGQRLDNYLFAKFRQVPKGRIYKMLRKGEVRINGGRKKQSYRLCAGDKIRLPPVVLEERADSGAAPESMVSAVTRNIIDEDSDLLILNKPAGIAVHSGSSIKHGIIEILRQARPIDTYLELVHRLDKGTSGCLMLARNRKALNEVHRMLREGEVTKKYLALVSGQWHGGIRRLEHHLLSSSAQQQKTRVDKQGKLAISVFNPIEKFSNATLMEVTIETGRTHQIRVQSAAIGHPVLGDDKYGDFEKNRQWRKQGLRRMFLHAAETSFYWSNDNRNKTFNAPLPKELTELIDQLSATRTT